MKGFRDFLLRGNLVELAVAVVMGVVLGAVVSALVADLITPLIAAIGGKPDFARLSFTINGSQFRYGHFMNALLTFLIIAAVVYFLVLKPVAALLERSGPEPEVAARRACPECLFRHPGRGPALCLLRRREHARAVNHGPGAGS